MSSVVHGRSSNDIRSFLRKQRKTSYASQGVAWFWYQYLRPGIIKSARCASVSIPDAVTRPTKLLLGSAWTRPPTFVTRLWGYWKTIRQICLAYSRTSSWDLSTIHLMISQASGLETRQCQLITARITSFGKHMSLQSYHWARIHPRQYSACAILCRH